MEGSNSESQPVLILGGGRGGLAFIELFKNEPLFHVIGVVDQNPDAPAFALAEVLKIAVFGKVEDALDACKPCTVFNLTHDEAVSDVASEAVGASSVIGGLEARLIWQMVTQLKETRSELQKSQLLNQSIISHAMEGIILINTRGTIIAFNPAAELMFGYSQDEVVGEHVGLLMPRSDRVASDGFLQRYMRSMIARIIGTEVEVTALRQSGKSFPMSLSVNKMAAGDDHYYIGIVSDISDRKKNEAAIKRLAHYDGNTGLPNRTLFFDRLRNSLAHAARCHQNLAVLFLDLDGFKAINDTLGHVAGDRLLKEVAIRLLKSIREADTVARFGGDEFAFILNDVENEGNAALVANKVLGRLSEPFLIDGEACNIGGSIGISMFPDDHVDMDSLIIQADTAMYAAKNNGKNHHRFFEQSMEPVYL